MPEIVTKVKKLNEEDDEDAKPKASAVSAPPAFHSQRKQRDYVRSLY